MDGNSKDETIKIINSHKQGIKLIKNKNDKGLYHAMNVGIKESSGDIIGILNSDDIYFKNALKIVNEYFNKHKDLDFFRLRLIKYAFKKLGHRTRVRTRVVCNPRLNGTKVRVPPSAPFISNFPSISIPSRSTFFGPSLKFVKKRFLKQTL